MRSPIIKQILGFGIISGVISLLLACFAFGIVEFYKIKDASTVKLQSQVDMLAYNLQPTLLFDDKDAADKILRSLVEDKSIIRAALYKSNGRPFAAYLVSKNPGNIKIVKRIYYQNKLIGSLVLASVYQGLKEKYTAYLLISLLIILISIPAAYAISAPIRREVSLGVEQLEQQTIRLRQLADQVATTEQRERKRIAALIHDHLQQIMAASKIQLELGLRRLKNQEYAETELKLHRGLDLLAEAGTAARSLMVELRPPVLYEAGLNEALKWLAHKFKADHNMEVSLDMQEIPAISDNLKILVFESVKELLFNAAKYSGVSKARLSLHSAGGHIMVRVEDTGRGFDIHRVENASVAQKFGLFSIRERIKLLNGSFQIDSAVDHGTRVRIMVPVGKAVEPAPVQKSAAAQPPRPANPLRKINILLVDDHKIVREGLANLLKEHELFNVVAHAEDGVEALEKTGIFLPDVIIMDVNMPRLNGIEATRAIKQKYSHVRIIGLSVQDERDVAESMKKAGALTLINKAGDPQELIRTILSCSSIRF